MATHNPVVARRYSKALWMHAQENKGTAENWLAALEALVACIDQSKDLAQLLESPSFSFEKKWAVVEEVLNLVKSPAEINKFMRVLMRAGRAAALSDIVESFKDIVNDANQTVEALVQTALPLTEQQSRTLVERLQKSTGKKITLTVQESPDLLAGLRVKIMGRTLDASLVSNLGLMQQVLLRIDNLGAEA